MRPQTNVNYFLRGVLVLLGAVIIFLGLNVGFGGIQTLGWQGGAVDFFTVTNEPVFAVHDNHVRFIGGVWLGLGLLMVVGSVAFQNLRPVLVALSAMIFIGGIARFSSGDLTVLFGGDVAPSLIFELAVMPLLGIWFLNAERRAVAKSSK